MGDAAQFGAGETAVRADGTAGTGAGRNVDFDGESGGTAWGFRMAGAEPHADGTVAGAEFQRKQRLEHTGFTEEAQQERMAEREQKAVEQMRRLHKLDRYDHAPDY